MKNILLQTIFYLFISFSTVGQNHLDLKTRVPKTIFGTPNLGFEFIFNEHLSAEINGGLHIGLFNNIIQNQNPAERQMSGFYNLLQGRFYLIPHYGGDGIYLGLYNLYQSNKTIVFQQETTINRLSLGFNMGYKWVTNFGLSIDLGAGLGKDLMNRTFFNGTLTSSQGSLFGIHILGNLSVGYRFSNL